MIDDCSNISDLCICVEKFGWLFQISLSYIVSGIICCCLYLLCKYFQENSFGAIRVNTTRRCCVQWRIQFERRANCSLEWILNTKIFHKFENRRRNVSTWQVMSDLLWTLMWILFYLPTMMARSTPQSRMPSPTRNSLGESELAILIILWTNSSCSRWFSWTYSTTCQSCWSSSTSQTQETSQSVESIK